MKLFRAGCKHKAMIYKKIINKFFPYHQCPVANPGLSEFEINSGVISHFVIKKLVPLLGFGPFPLNEQFLLAATVCRFKPGLIFEWGTHVGKSARLFYETARYFNIPAEIHSVDLPPDTVHIEQPGRKRGRLVKGKKGVFLHLGDGLAKSLEIYRGKKVLNEQVKVLFFVDGDHSRDSVERELRGILENVHKPIILLHDTFYQSEESGYNIGPFLVVQKVWDELHLAEDFNMIETKTGLPGLTLIYPK